VPSVITPLPVVVLASGRGGTFAALLDAQQNGRLPIDIRALLSDRRTAPALEIAESRGVPTVALRPRDFPERPGFDRALFLRAAEFEPALIVLAGYMRVIDADVVAGWLGRLINLHPSLLPKYPGLDTYARVLEAGDTTFGASVHFVTDKLDGGPVIAQVALPVLPGDTADALAARLRPAEQDLLVGCIRLIAAGRIVLGRKGVELDGRPLSFPPQLNASGGFAGL
jgi:phosphoribosylglycinamide formyltransferase-1